MLAAFVPRLKIQHERSDNFKVELLCVVRDRGLLAAVVLSADPRVQDLVAAHLLAAVRHFAAANPSSKE